MPCFECEKKVNISSWRKHLHGLVVGRTYLMLLLLSRVWLFVAPWTAACPAPLSSTVSWCLLKSMSIEFMMLLTISSSAAPFSFCLWSFPASESFPMNWLLPPDGQSIGASTSATVFPMNIQGWCPLGLTCLTSLQSKGLSRVFSSTTINDKNHY